MGAADGENTTGRKKGVLIDNPLSQTLTHHTGLKLKRALAFSKSGQMAASIQLIIFWLVRLMRLN